MTTHTILVTGSSRGIGRAIAARLARDSYAIVVHGRDANACESVAQELRAAGGSARVHDPKAMEVARQLYGERLYYAADPYDALAGAQALVVVTEWLQYRNPDFERMHTLLKTPVVFDGRNLYDPERMIRLGFEYHGIGRRTP